MALAFTVEEIPGGDPGVYWVTPSDKGTGALCAKGDRDHLITSLGSLRVGEECELLVELGGSGAAMVVKVVSINQGIATLQRVRPRRSRV